MRELIRQELKSILDEHVKWLNDKGGCRADLRSADLRSANLCGADLRSANLSGADLRSAENLDSAFCGELTSFFAIQCPEEGSFTAWKKCKDSTIVKLLIPEDAKRSSATSRKCRASKAVVLSIYNKKNEEILETHSNYDESFIYKVGETVSVNNFDDNRWNECASGIHFFITRKEAEQY